MRYTYEINEKNEIRIWDTENPNDRNAPFFFQPTWPNGQNWNDKTEAESWVKLFVESLENANSEFLPGDSPEQPKKIRPQPVTYDPNTGLPVEGTI